MPVFTFSRFDIAARQRGKMMALFAKSYGKIAVYDRSCSERPYIARGLHNRLQMMRFQGKLCGICPTYDSDRSLFNLSSVHCKLLTERPRRRIQFERLRRDVCYKKEVIAIRCDAPNDRSKVREINKMVRVLNLETIKSFGGSEIPSPFASHISLA